MKRLPVSFLCICMVVSLASCGGKENGQASDSQTQMPASGQTQTVQPDTAQPESEPPIEAGSNEVSVQASASDSRILIAYFTWADNTQVENPEAVDVDATTSASVLPPGNAAKIAGWIQERTGGDLFSVIVEEPYSSDYDECLDRAADEKAEDARPALVSHVEDMGQYDTVFLGFPNWYQDTASGSAVSRLHPCSFHAAGTGNCIPDKPDADIETSLVLIHHGTVGAAHIFGKVIPPAATICTACPGGCAYRISLFPIRICSINIPCPLAYIPVHIIKPQRVG